MFDRDFYQRTQQDIVISHIFQSFVEALIIFVLIINFILIFQLCKDKVEIDKPKIAISLVFFVVVWLVFNMTQIYRIQDYLVQIIVSAMPALLVFLIGKNKIDKNREEATKTQ